MGISDRKKKETEALRQRVLDVAEEIFVNEGVKKVTMRRVASRVDYAPTVLYRLFANKNDLMDHLIARGYQGVRERYDEVHKHEGLTPLAELKIILFEYARYALEHSNHYQMWFDTSELQKDGHLLKMSHRRLEFVVFQAWIERIEACMKIGLFPNRDPQEVFQILWSRVHGIISLRIQHSDFPWIPLDRHLEDIVYLQVNNSPDAT